MQLSSTCTNRQLLIHQSIYMGILWPSVTTSACWVQLPRPLQGQHRTVTAILNACLATAEERMVTNVTNSGVMKKLKVRIWKWTNEQTNKRAINHISGSRSLIYFYLHLVRSRYRTDDTCMFAEFEYELTFYMLKLEGIRLLCPAIEKLCSNEIVMFKEKI